jgi:hypothetical protein
MSSAPFTNEAERLKEAKLVFTVTTLLENEHSKTQSWMCWQRWICAAFFTGLMAAWRSEHTDIPAI